MVPLPVGAVKEILTELELDTVATRSVGALGLVLTSVDVVDESDVPPELVAVIVNVYGVFEVNPETVIGEDEPYVVITSIPEVVDALVIVYPFVMMDPLPVGAVKEILTVLELDTVAVTLVGELGAVVTTVDAIDEPDIPPELVAVIVNV
jgi:hypothetical protein